MADEKAIARVHFPLSTAYVCTNCLAVFRAQRRCPACTSSHIDSVEAWLTRAREARQRVKFEAKVADEMKTLTKGLER